MHIYEVRSRKDHRGVDLISDAAAGFKDLTDHTFDCWTITGLRRPKRSARRDVVM
jgi:hypothetical protein